MQRRPYAFVNTLFGQHHVNPDIFCGANTKEVIDYVKNALNNIEKTEFEATQMADFQSQFQWFLGFAFVLLFADVFLLERKTKWVNKLNLFNEKEQ